jgi:hypothetical protein
MADGKMACRQAGKPTDHPAANHATPPANHPCLHGSPAGRLTNKSINYKAKNRQSTERLIKLILKTDFNQVTSSTGATPFSSCVLFFVLDLVSHRRSALHFAVHSRKPRIPTTPGPAPKDDLPSCSLHRTPVPRSQGES